MPVEIIAMRIYFNNINHPKKAAKRIQKAFQFIYDAESYDGKSSSFTAFGTKEITPIKLAEAQYLTAYMLGYDDWHELEVTTAGAKQAASPFDEEVSPEVQEERLRYQWSRLNEYYPNGLVNYINHAGRVSAKSPTSKKLYNRMGLENTMFFNKKYGVWEFEESMRSSRYSTVANDIQDGFGFGQCSLGEAMDKLDDILRIVPESITAIWASLSILMQAGDDENDLNNIAIHFSEEIGELEQRFVSAIPDEYWVEGVDRSLDFSDMDSRDPVRITSMLGHLYYSQKDYKKARKWFSIMQEMSDYFDEPYAPIITDLEKSKPNGNVRPHF